MKLLSPHGFIFQLRDEWVMLDLRLAELYEIEPDVLRDTIRKNIDRFPTNSMFILTREEYDFLRTEFAILEREGLGRYNQYISYGYPEKGAFAFGEQGLRILERLRLFDNPNEKNQYLIEQNVIKQNAIIKQNDSIVLELRVKEIFDH